jgi:biofilm PGA synthesis protein PgaA
MDSGEIIKQAQNGKAEHTSHSAGLHGIAASAVLASLLICNNAISATPGQISEQRERAVATARSGQLEQAIAELQRLDAATPDMRTTHDLIVVLTWAGRIDDALNIYEQRGIAANAPDYVQAAVARAYRSRGAHAQAERISRNALEKNPGAPAWTILLALVMTDQGRAADADRLLQGLTEKNPDNTDAWLARGYAARTLGQPYAAMRAYAEVRRLQPQNAEAARELQNILLELRAPYAAAAQTPAAPPAIRARQAASMVRWGADVPADNGQSRFAKTDAAIRRLENLIVETQRQSPVDRTLLWNLERDRAVALRNRERWGDTLAAVEALRAAGDVIPSYVRLAEADALLALHQPERARSAYQDVLAGDKNNREARIGLFYAEIETENFAAAFANVDALASAEGPRRDTPGRSRPEPNDDWLGAQILAANARHYADMHSEAWDRLLPLAQRAPGLGYLRSALGSVAAARGWPRLAEEEVRIAASLAPEDRGIEIALADSDLRRADIESAKTRVASLMSRFPDDLSVQRLKRDITIAEMREFRLDVSSRREHGTALSAPGGGSQTAARLYSSPYAGRLRAVAAAERATAYPVEGRVLRERLGAGAEYAGPDVTVEAIAWQNSGTLSKDGASLIGSWRPNDHWAIYAGAEAYSGDTPLRAQFYGITGNAVDLGGEYRWHESRSISASVRSVEFSDGNRRQSERVVFIQRLIDQPHFDLDIRPEYYASRNSKLGAPYFNPVSDQALTLALEAEHVISRHYDRSWVQRVVFAAGSYRQEGFGSGAIGSLSYEQRYRFDPTFEIRYGVEMNRRIYDGTAERGLTGFFSINKRF